MNNLEIIKILKAMNQVFPRDMAAIKEDLINIIVELELREAKSDSSNLLASGEAEGSSGPQNAGGEPEIDQSKVIHVDPIMIREDRSKPTPPKMRKIKEGEQPQKPNNWDG